MEYGCAKYSPDNWKKGLNREELLESMQRHLDALFEGQEWDPDQKKHPTHHIGHIMANCVFYLWHFVKGTFSERREELGASFKTDKPINNGRDNKTDTGSRGKRKKKQTKKRKSRGRSRGI